MSKLIDLAHLSRFLDNIKSVFAKKSDLEAKYTKPSGGIPKTDLAASVQTSLGKADTALQSVKTINGMSIVGTGNVEIPADEDLLYWGTLFQDGDNDMNDVEEITIGSITYDYGGAFLKDSNVCKVGRVIAQINPTPIEPDEGYEYYEVTRFVITGVDSADYILTLERIEKATSDVFIATYGTTTAAEVDAAVAAGKLVVARLNDVTAILSSINSTSYSFGNNYNGYLVTFALNRSTNNWSSSTFSVTPAWRNTPDNTHIPSEKLVYDSLSTKVSSTDVTSIVQVNALPQNPDANTLYIV